jgi:hypothetical protein
MTAGIRPTAIAGYEGLQTLLDRFAEDHPDFEKNVFIAMRFRSSKQFDEITNAIRSALSLYGLSGRRADDKVYPPDADLWTNVCVYMMGCNYAVCLFEEIDEREFNPNVPLEYGFFRAMNRRVLLLKDKRMPKLPTDMTGKLYREFDAYEITRTINEQIGQWAQQDLGLVQTAAEEDPNVRALIWRYLGHLQRGTVDRAALSRQLNDDLTPQELERIAEQFGSFGRLQSIVYRNTNLEDDFTVYRYTGIFASLQMPFKFVLDHDRKIAGFWREAIIART